MYVKKKKIDVKATEYPQQVFDYWLWLIVDCSIGVWLHTCISSSLP